ncbi:hypothetical protein V5799_009068 [Amblyomma americanum]|uniref:Uncharacterized protein n=1 Tax=Amblyomma americanum TaxID=6943 RepID=A0AAQ4FCK7_AMBAM
MPPRGTQYTLVGFAPDLDWRPLRFVQRIPPNRICLACGLVCRTTALLPCMHLLCQSCYEHCTLDGEHVCPLDGHYFQDRDVDWKETLTDEILRKQVSCWNDGSGCEAVYRFYVLEGCVVPYGRDVLSN